jgi:glycosyltransferase involved in cell wall biosynthesis
MNLSDYSVLLTVYGGDDPDELETALESVVTQSLPPTEVVVVKDGPVGDEISSTLNRYSCHSEIDFVLCGLKENQGRGAAAKHGLKRCQYDLVGLMSADDICLQNRFERQVRFLNSHPEIDVVGGYVAEFDKDPDDPIAFRKVPTEPTDIRRFARSRNPMTEVSVLFRRDVVVEVGGYRSVDRLEDWDLWVRLLQNGATFANIPEVLVQVRAGEDMFGRRGGFEYAREEIRQQYDFFRWGFIGVFRLFYNLLTRVPIRFFPNRLRGWVYMTFARTA